MVGWTTFTIEHVMYGAVLGVASAATSLSSKPESRWTNQRHLERLGALHDGTSVWTELLIEVVGQALEHVSDDAGCRRLDA
jgi:hypothetical protein